MSQTIKVQILGSEYPLRSNDEPLTRELALEVDTQMREFQQKLPSQSTTTLAVLTALNFAEVEAHQTMNELREVERITNELEELSDALEKAIAK